MEKGKTSAVFLTQRDSGHVGQELQKVNWDNLVDDVFKEEVDQFFIESGVHSLHIRQRTNNWCSSHPSSSKEQGWPLSATSSASTSSSWKSSTWSAPARKKENISPLVGKTWDHKDKTRPTENQSFTQKKTKNKESVW